MYYKAAKELSTLAEKLGIDLDGEFEKIGLSSERHDEARARAAMGLSK